MKNGIATITEHKKKDNSLKNPFISPCANDIPSKILFLQMFPIPNNARPANPRDSTPIRAALRFCLYMTRVCPSILSFFSDIPVSFRCLPESPAVSGCYYIQKSIELALLVLRLLGIAKYLSKIKPTLNLILCSNMQWHKTNT